MSDNGEQQMTDEPKLKAYIVEYTIAAEGPQVQFFKAHAENEEHAEEQCLDAYPTAAILNSYAGLKPYVVRLSLPVEAISLPAAIETFLDMAKRESWVFTVETPEGRYLVDTEVVEGKVQQFLVMLHPNDRKP